MEMKKWVLMLCLVFVSLRQYECSSGLQVGFYKTTCPNLETIVSRVVSERFFKDSSIAPALIRLYFHDCFSNGCDASLLLDGDASEKTAPPNLSVRGYDVIDDVKNAVEAECKGVVSCADIIAIATRDVVTLSSGEKTWYEIPTGRFDGLVSTALTVDLPSPRLSVSKTAEMFAKRGLSVTDMVYLLGGHTIGVGHCSFILQRLYNYQNTSQSDPTMDPQLVKELRLRCPQNSKTDNAINLDQNNWSSNVLDVSYYQQISLRRGIFEIDQELAIDGMTNKTVMEIANGNDFLTKFGQAMVKMGFVGVKSRSNGEVRTSCRSPNKIKSLLP